MNPILESRFYIPDVEARQWDDGKVYLYGSMDISGNNAYCSQEYAVFESVDMKSWTVHPQSFTSRQVHDVCSRESALYAPDCEKINGRYCLFYCQENKREGVAFSERPEGPFRNARSIIPADGDGIDPAILVDDDGSLYYFWGQMHAKGGRLDLETGTIIPETLTYNILTEEEHGFHEGISIRKRNGIYYLVYSDISRGRPTCLGYATSLNPLGPYKKGGIIIDNTGCDPKSWNNHGSICEINQEWYVFYHRATHNSYFSRQVCAERIHFNEDGSIDEVEMTTQGIEEPLDALKMLDAYRACQLQGTCYVDEYKDEQRCYEYVANLCPGDRLIYKYLDFAAAPDKILLEASCKAAGLIVEVFLDDENEPVARIQINRTSGQHEFVRFYSSVNRDIIGVHSLSLRICGKKNAAGALKSICFIQSE